MRIALDFDDTFTADPKLWTQFVKLANGFGHEVIIVTGRTDNEENRADIRAALGSLQLRKILCNFKPKKQVCDRMGVKIDIWIDDWPAMIVGWDAEVKNFANIITETTA